MLFRLTMLMSMVVVATTSCSRAPFHVLNTHPSETTTVPVLPPYWYLSDDEVKQLETVAYSDRVARTKVIAYHIGKKNDQRAVYFLRIAVRKGDPYAKEDFKKVTKWVKATNLSRTRKSRDSH